MSLDHIYYVAAGMRNDQARKYFFEDAEDARWFYREGYKRMLYEGEERPARLELWVDDVEEAWQINGREMTPEPIHGKDCSCLTTESCPALDPDAFKEC